MQTKKHTARLKRELRDAKRIAQCAREFNVIGDPTRLKICYLLCRRKELSVGEIAAVVGVSVSAVSRTLRTLTAARAVTHRRDFRRVYYQLAPSPLAALVKKRLQKI